MSALPRAADPRPVCRPPTGAYHFSVGRSLEEPHEHLLVVEHAVVSVQQRVKVVPPHLHVAKYHGVASPGETGVWSKKVESQR